jgi:lipoprotein-anchoring transpeptidase ErfK/SrfK
MKTPRLSTLAIAVVTFAATLVATLMTASPAVAREIVAFRGYPIGSIVVRTNERRLYYVAGPGMAWRYPVGVGRAGKAWSGRASVYSKQINPAWAPPPDVRRDSPHLPRVIPGGAPNNPLGVAVLALDYGSYAIHGTNNPGSVGRFVSYGCIRMYNHDVMELYRVAGLGTQVYVLP